MGYSIIREIVSDVYDVTPIEFPEFWDPTFIRQLMLGTQDAQKKIIHIKDLYTKYPKLLSNSEKHLGDRNIYSSAAIKFATNVKNHHTPLTKLYLSIECRIGLIDLERAVLNTFKNDQRFTQRKLA